MSGDFNKLGETYDSIAVADEREDYNMLSNKPLALLNRLRSVSAATYKDADPGIRRRARESTHCLDRLITFLLQVSRISTHTESLKKRPLPGAPPGGADLKPGSLWAVGAREACADFESLLLHGRAALDRLTYFVATEYGQECDQFSRLHKMLLGCAPKGEERANRIIELLKEARCTKGVLTDLEGKKGLRSLVAHRTSISEGTRIAFTIHWLPDGRFLMFDCEALGYPVLSTARSLAAEVPYLVLNTVAIYLGETDILPLVEFEPLWRNPTVVYSQYLDSSRSGPLFSVIRMDPVDFHIMTDHLKPEVLKFAEPP